MKYVKFGPTDFEVSQLSLGCMSMSGAYGPHRRVCRRHGVAQCDGVIPIPSCKTRAHLEDNLTAIEIDLTPADLARLNALMPPDPAAGAREQVTR